MYELALAVGALVAIIAAGVAAERFLRPLDPLIPVSQPTKVLVLGTALGGPFALHSQGLVPVSDGWDLVATLALALVLYVPAARLVGVAEGIGSGAGDTGC